VSARRAHGAVVGRGPAGGHPHHTLGRRPVTPGCSAPPRAGAGAGADAPLPPVPPAAGGHDPSWRSLRGVEVLDPLDPDPAWSVGAPLLTGQAMPFASGALLGRDLYIVGGAMFSSVVARYEGGPAGGWAACPALGTPRVHAAVAAAAGRLFVCGGRSQVNQVGRAGE
jgi:hypothetical protein